MYNVDMDKIYSIYVRPNGKYIDIVAVDKITGEHLVIAMYERSRWPYLRHYFDVDEPQPEPAKDGAG